MSTTITIATLSGSTYELRCSAADCLRRPTTIRHSRGPFVPPEALLARGAWTNCADGYHVANRGRHVVLVVPGHILHTSPITSITVGDVDIPVDGPLGGAWLALVNNPVERIAPPVDNHAGLVAAVQPYVEAILADVHADA